jgi:hypothetical protein
MTVLITANGAADDAIHTVAPQLVAVLIGAFSE